MRNMPCQSFKTIKMVQQYVENNRDLVINSWTVE